MNLEQLKAALDAAALALKTTPEDATLKDALQKAQADYDKALAESENASKQKKRTEEGNSDELDVSKLDPKAQKLISDLRKENADRRTANKALAESNSKVKKALVEAGIIEDDEADPEEKLKQTSQNLNQATVDIAVLKAAVEYGVGKDDLEYFDFLVNKKLAALADDEELDEEKFAELAKQAKRTSAKGSSTTSVNSDPNKKPDGDPSDVTLDAFVNMTMGEKSALYQKNPALYSKLKNEAVAKRLL